MRVDPSRTTKVFRGRGRDRGARREGRICKCLVDELRKTCRVDASTNNGDVAGGESVFCK